MQEKFSPVKYPYSSIYIDMKMKYLLKSISQFISPSERSTLFQLIENKFAKSRKQERLLITVAVRSALDLAFQVFNFPPGSEIICSCVNIPDMITIIRHHGLIPIPVEIDMKCLKPDLEDIKKALSPNTKAVMVSYLFGSRFDSTEIFKWAKSKNLIIFEDEAESFDDIERNGHELADFSFFSFGTIKPFTAYGGAITIIRNNEGVYRKMKYLLDNYPIMDNKFYWKKIWKNMAAYLALNKPMINQTCKRIANRFNIDYKEITVAMVRGIYINSYVHLLGFQTNPVTFLHTFRLQIPTPMLYMLCLRIYDFDKPTFDHQLQKLHNAQNRLLENDVQIPGYGNPGRSFWLFPIITKNPILTFKLLNARGVDAYLGATQLRLVHPPLGDKFKFPEQTRNFFENIIYLPFHRDVPQNIIEKMVEETIQVIKYVEKLEQQKQIRQTQQSKL